MLDVNPPVLDFGPLGEKRRTKLETKINNLFAIGDGAGITRGLIQASASGVIAAREIQQREK